MTTPAADSRSTLIHAVLDRPGDDPIFSLNAEAVRRSRAGEDILNATLGALMDDEGRLAILPSVFEALRAVPPEAAAAYAPIAGPPRFLEAVVRELFGTGALAESAVAVATPGGTGALHHAIVNFLEPGQALLTTSYYWSPYQILAAHTGRRVETFRMFDGEGRIDLAALERGLRRQVEAQGRALLILNTPCHNPTGYALDAREWREVLELTNQVARSAPVALAVDHAYAKFGREGTEPWAEAGGALEGDAVLLVAWTVSKSFAQYGARVGALVACHRDEAERRRIQNALSFSCRGTWSNCNHHGMLAITELLSDPGLRERSDLERARLRRLLDERVSAFNRHAARAGLRYPRYEGGFFVTVFTPDAERTAGRMRELGVFVVPLSGAVRVALCSTPARAVPRLVDALREGLAAAGVRAGS